jgi:hypothetical protein
MIFASVSYRDCQRLKFFFFLSKNRIRNKTTGWSRSKHPGVVKVSQFSSSKHRDTPVVNSRDTEFGSVVLNIQLETPLSFLQFTIVPETEKW